MLGGEITSASVGTVLALSSELQRRVRSEASKAPAQREVMPVTPNL